MKMLLWMCIFIGALVVMGLTGSSVRSSWDAARSGAGLGDNPEAVRRTILLGSIFAVCAVASLVSGLRVWRIRNGLDDPTSERDNG